MIEDLAIQSITLIAFLAFATKRLMNYLHALQQEDYDNGRLMTWIVRHKVYDSRISQLLIMVSGIAMLTSIPSSILNIIIFLAFILAAYFEKDPRKQSKKALTITKRARRILLMALLLTTIFASCAFYIQFPAIWIIVVQAIPFMLLLGNSSLAPYEAAVQKKFYNEAQAKLAEVNPTVIAITGSYGKTSVKHILGHILKNAAPTLTTPGSVNTVMGVTRIIREQMEPHHKYFITEMGAYGPGSIAGLCAFTPPDIGIITSIGHAHYERFKSLETVVHAKYELAESVLARNGTMIVHEKTLKFQHSRNIRNRAMDNFIACGEPSKTQNPTTQKEFSYLAPNDLKIISVKQTPKGLCIKLEWQEESYTLRAPLYGIHHGHNIALAFACAMTLGMDAKDIKSALATTAQIRHRLEVKQQSDGTIIIDDAYNSNPPGFRSALHVLGVLAADQGGRAILVTPGIVELGTAHDEVHTTLGTLAAGTCDIVIAVNPQRIPTFINAFQTNSRGKILMEVDSFAQAQEWIFANKKNNDVILLENDLPDIYEKILKI